MKTMFYERIDEKDRYLGSISVIEKESGQCKTHTYSYAGCLEVICDKPAQEIYEDIFGLECLWLHIYKNVPFKNFECGTCNGKKQDCELYMVVTDDKT